MGKTDINSNSGTSHSALEYAFIGCLFSFTGDEPTVNIEKAISLHAKREWFTDRTCRLLWTAAENLWDNASMGDISPLSILEKGREIITEHRRSGMPKGGRLDDWYGDMRLSTVVIDDCLRHVSSEANVSYYARALSRAYMGRRMLEVCERVRDGLKDTSSMAAELCNSIVTEFEDIVAQESSTAENDLDKELNKIRETDMKAYEEVTVKGNEDYVPGYRLPWRKMTFLYSGLGVGFHIIGARPSVGKTSFALQLMRFFCENGMKVVFNTLDMSIGEFLRRPLSDISQVSGRKSKFGRTTPEDNAAIDNAARELRKWHAEGLLSVVTEYDVHQFRSYCRRKHRAGKLDVAMVDFVQIMGFKGSASQPETKVVTEVSRSLKTIVNELQIPLIALSQLSRDGVKDGRNPELTDLRSSGALEQDATTVAFLYRDAKVCEKWKQNPPEQYSRGGYQTDVRAIWFDLKKNQVGDVGSIPFVVFQKTGTWYLGDFRQHGGEESFARIHDDWRHTAMETFCRDNGSLIDSEVEFRIERKNESMKAEGNSANGGMDGGSGMGRPASQPATASPLVDDHVDDFSAIESEADNLPPF